MNERIDHGDIIKVVNFPIWQEKTVEKLKRKASLFSLNLLNTIISDIVDKKPLEPCGTKWGDHLYTQKSLEEAQAQEVLKAS